MDDLFGLIVIIIGIAAGIYSDKKKKEGVQKKAAVPNQPGGGRKMYHRHRFLMVVMQEDRILLRMRQMRCRENYLQDSRN